mgnify:CR=1 FL=1
MTNETIGEAAFETLAGTPETPAEARNGIRHVVSLSLTKLADGLINPKLVFHTPEGRPVPAVNEGRVIRGLT